MRPLDGAAVGVLVGVLASAACQRAPEPDAYGNVEATEVVVGAEAAGRLVTFTVDDGDTLATGAMVGAIDPTELGLQRDQLVAQRTATASRIGEVDQQIAALEAQRGSAAAQHDAARSQRDALSVQYDIARRNFDRATRLFAQQAATAQQVDQAEREYRVLGEQIKAQDNQITAQEHQVGAQAGQIQAARAQVQTLRHQVAAVEAQVKQIDERIRRTQVINPVAGTVLTSYAKAGEMVQMGQPLYRIANLDTVDVRAYVAEPRLAAVRLGQDVSVSVDAGRDERRKLPGTVTWISSQAEFTPTPIQTREERADLVYAIKIRVRNGDGVLKIGMPVDVQLAGDTPR